MVRAVFFRGFFEVKSGQRFFAKAGSREDVTLRTAFEPVRA